jgi:Subtilase family/PA domain
MICASLNGQRGGRGGQRGRHPLRRRLARRQHQGHHRRRHRRAGVLPHGEPGPAGGGHPRGEDINGINANGIPVPPILPAQVLRNPNGTVSLGCNPQDYVDQGVAGKLVIVQRGTCARVARAIFGQNAGAAAVVMINNSTGLPPFEGAITSNPDTGEPYVVTIPFIGVRGLATSSTSDGFALVQRDGLSIGLSAGTPIQTGLASFTSGGPRMPDSHLKPDVAAPGENIVSAFIGSGDQGIAFSGTSMATPHVAGTAALAVQAHPTWKPAAIKSAIINSGIPTALADYAARRAGSGLINAASAAGSLTYAYADKDETTLNFGLDELKTDLTRTGMIHVKNTGATPITFTGGVAQQQGSPHTLTLSGLDSPNDGLGRIVFNVDFGLLTANAFNGQEVAAIVNLSTGDLFVDFYAIAPTNGSTILLPVLASDIGVSGQPAIRLQRDRVRPRKRRHRHVHVGGLLQRVQQRDQQRAVRSGRARRLGRGSGLGRSGRVRGDPGARPDDRHPGRQERGGRGQPREGEVLAVSCRRNPGGPVQRGGASPPGDP